ncbi:SHOCT domain-containing protein [Microbacterium thalassium]|uniref:Phage shock protein PspC (Stress-responsive transcriptional regulator) n=1 Tax=Microbacterium thalassium TaxID=362649 RepID=A0A7X0FQP9_9MICO|nr:SHOCT domain-containing protein [Microbacterium thalassium]MBB6391851.1 phage shock protein PspC (stress-responsive transcriptional regulator) [Microbacterium thalassium]GLK23871.1 membrane protein [Microbacterium thalassium]
MGLLGDFFWILLWSFYFMAYIYIVVLVIMDLFRDEELNGWLKAVWIVFLVFVPFLTGLVYIIARGRGMAARTQGRRAAVPEEDDYRPAASASPSEDIARAKALLDSGAISQGEFDALKSKALGNQYFGA